MRRTRESRSCGTCCHDARGAKHCGEFCKSVHSVTRSHDRHSPFLACGWQYGRRCHRTALAALASVAYTASALQRLGDFMGFVPVGTLICRNCTRYSRPRPISGTSLGWIWQETATSSKPSGYLIAADDHMIPPPSRSTWPPGRPSTGNAAYLPCRDILDGTTGNLNPTGISRPAGCGRLAGRDRAIHPGIGPLGQHFHDRESFVASQRY